MPSLAVPKHVLFGALGPDHSEKLFEQQIFDFGIELDDIYEENGLTMYKFDIPANRYDLLCAEGLLAAMRVYISGEHYNDITPTPPTTSLVAERVDGRPFILCAVIRGINMSQATYDSLIGYQDKLHLSIGRNRSLISMGTHDFDRMQQIPGPLRYAHVDRSSTRFTPLNSSAEIALSALPEHLKHDKRMQKYIALHPSRTHLPAVLKGETVISVPPIINSDITKVTLATTNIFVEVTGTSFAKVNIALKMLLYNFRGASLESVNILYEKGSKMDDKVKSDALNPANQETLKSQSTFETTSENLSKQPMPDFKAVNNFTKEDNKNSLEQMNDLKITSKGNLAKVNPLESLNKQTANETDLISPVFINQRYALPIATINSKLNSTFTAAEAKALLERMMHTVILKDDLLLVDVPDVRADIMHECDLVEDAAVAYGFNNFPKVLPGARAIGSEDPLNKFADKIRLEFAMAGFCEALTLTLLSRDENFIDSAAQIVLANPKSRECEVARTSLIPGLLKAVAANLHGRIPIKMFEVADVVKLDGFIDEQLADNQEQLAGNQEQLKVMAPRIPSPFDNTRPSDEGAHNCRHFAAILAANTSLLEELQGPVTFLLTKAGFATVTYEHIDDPNFLKDQAARVLVDGVAVGQLGVLHPSVLNRFKVCYAASAVELNIDRIFRLFMSSN